MQTAPPSSSVLYCENHPNKETRLRCNRCNKLICAECAIHTPTGYRCKECVAEQSKKFDTALWSDYVMGFGIGAILGYIGALIASRIGFFTIFLAPFAGRIIADAVRTAVKKRRAKLLFRLTVLGVVLGSLVPLLPLLLFFLMGGGLGFSFSILWQAVYTFVAASTTYYRLSGINFRR
jgi:hypothetical protein